ncbi:MAG: DUF4198 domain-containing protein [Elainellaceae cyanobacterium]
MKKSWLLGLAALSLLAAQPVIAHSIWLSQEGSDLSIVYGGHGGETEGYEPSKVQDVTAFDLDGNPVDVELITNEDSVDVDPSDEVALVAVTFDNGFWVETSDGWQNVSKREVEDYISSSHPLKYTKALYGWSEAIAQPVGLPLEIVPMTNPFELEAGDELAIQVLLDGEPASDIEVIYGFAEDAPIMTDESGMAMIPLAESGLQHLEASIRLPVEDNPDTDQIYHSSTLTFEVE